MDFLILHSYGWRPCMETAGEIALQFKSAGGEIGFYFLDIDDPFEPPPFSPPPFQAKKIRKVRQLKKILRASDIICPKLQAKPTRIVIPYDEINEIKSTHELSQFTYDGANLGSGVLSHVITILADPYPDLVLHSSLVKKGLIATIQAYEEAKLIIKQCAPREIIVYSGRVALSSAIVCVAHKAKLPIKFFEHGNTSFKKFIIRDGFMFDFKSIQRLIISKWESAKEGREQIANAFFICQRGGEQEIQNFNYVGNQKIGKVQVKKFTRVTFFSTSDDERMCLADSNPLGKSSIFSSQREAICFLMQWAEMATEIEFVIRVHPHVSKKAKSEQVYWNELKGKNITVIKSNSDIDSYALLESSDLVLTYGSTMGVEATYWRVPSISLSCSLYSGLGCVYEPASKQELTDFLEKIPGALPRESCFRYGYFASTIETNTYQYYTPTSASEGKFCGKELSMDLAMIRIIKKSSFGLLMKRLQGWVNYKMSG